MPMKVLHVCDFFLRYTLGLAQGMTDRGHEVMLFSRDHDLEFGGQSGAMRRYAATRAAQPKKHVTLPGRIRDPGAVPAVIRMRKSAAVFRPDVVHFQESVGTDLRLLLASGVPYKRFALTVHDPSPHLGERWPLSRRIGFAGLVRAAGLIFVHSEVLKTDLIRRVQPAAPVVVVPHGIDTPDVTELPQRPNILFFGRISTYYKGLDVLLDAMPRVWERLPDATLTIAGAGRIERHPSLDDGRVILRNEHISDEAVPSIFSAATCCVLPYREATQSGVGSEAKAHGRAIVATNVGGLPELVGADAGRLVPPGDPVALSEALVAVAGDRDLAAQYGKHAAASVDSAGWANVAKTTVEAYDRYLTP